MPKVDTLVDDIHQLLSSNVKVDPSEAKAFGDSLGTMLVERLSDVRGTPSLRLSNLGTPCRRRLWYTVNCDELGEKLPPSVRLKFLFGDILEHLLLFLATLAGHKVERQQEEVEINGVKGHIDAVIDGELVDCKSASTYSFNKFKSHSLGSDDAFGYLTQLGAYGSALNSKRNHFLVVDKTLGHITLDTWEQPDRDYGKDVDDVREILAENSPPPRHYEDVLDGKSGNRKLGVACSYCPFKMVCWPGVKQYNYARGPVFLTRVVREPRVDPE